MIQYKSTRGGDPLRSAASAVIKGLAEDRGLFVPDSIPALPFKPAEMTGRPYKEIAKAIIGAFFTDYTDADGRAHSIEIHAAFSIRKWKAGDRIRLRISRSDPEKVIVRSSDAAMAVIMCIIGAALEAVLLAVLIRTH